MENVELVLLDTKSIQQYIFSCNKLRLNLGASYIVSHIYREDLLAAVAEATGETLTDVSMLDEWKQNPATVRMFTEDVPFEVGYIGGGNAFLMFRPGLGSTFVERWTLRLLKEYPGLSTGVACMTVPVTSLQTNSFKQTLFEAFKLLAHNKSGQYPVTTPAKYGITMDCALDADSCETWHAGDTLDMFVSAAAEAKIQASLRVREDLQQRYGDILDGREFPSELDHLGQREGDSHVAIVQIDGNSMGKLLMGCTSLEQQRTFSVELARANEESFRHALAELVAVMPALEATEEFVFTDESRPDCPRYVPLRPLVGEGDDRTFATDARIALFFTESYMRYFSSCLVLGKPISCSAGIAIVKTAYPFYRAYRLAEQLCEAAKDARRQWQDSLDNPPDTSWLDFYLAYGGLSGDLSSIRERQYIVDGMRLHDGPYCLDPQVPGAGWPLLDDLIKGIRYFSPAADKWPHSKVKELRAALSSGKESTGVFLDEMRARGLGLPSTSAGTDPWVERATTTPPTSTPYFDMVELVELYPPALLDKRAEVRGAAAMGGKS